MHDGLEAQKAVCEYLYEKMKNIYGEIVPIPIEKVYKIKDFYKDSTPYRMAQWNDWLKV
jgi:hypothetical protein